VAGIGAVVKTAYSVSKAAYAVKNNSHLHFMLALRIFYDKKPEGRGLI
jgi:hypothetical protein